MRPHPSSPPSRAWWSRACWSYACVVALVTTSAAGCGERESPPADKEQAIVDVPPLMAVVPPDAATGARDDAPPPRREPDVIYVPTPQPVVDAMLELAEVGRGDLLYDLGCGDGRIPITAARRYGARAIGIDIDPALIREANANARQAGVTDLVSFREGDLFEEDFRDADVVTLYLLQSLNLKLRPRLLAELEPGTRIVSHDFDMGDWAPEKTLRVGNSTLYRWTVPERPQRQKD